MQIKSFIFYFVALNFFSTFQVHAYTIGEFMSALENGTQAEKEQQIIYFNGTMDALMYFKETIVGKSGGKKLVCFPTPFPSRETFYK